MKKSPVVDRPACAHNAATWRRTAVADSVFLLIAMRIKDSQKYGLIICPRFAPRQAGVSSGIIPCLQISNLQCGLNFGPPNQVF
ncbi:MAG: hypothetical protein KDH91_20275 [Rhodoferax sp.]|nr:hypothetical protein [Rhodoferax sp.]